MHKCTCRIFIAVHLNLKLEIKNPRRCTKPKSSHAMNSTLDSLDRPSQYISEGNTFKGCSKINCLSHNVGLAVKILSVHLENIKRLMVD